MSDLTASSLPDAELAQLLRDATARLIAAGGTDADAAAVRRYGEELTHLVQGGAYWRWPPGVLAQRDGLRSRGGEALVAAFHRAVFLDRAVASRRMLSETTRFTDMIPWFEQTVSGVVSELWTTPDSCFDLQKDGFAKDLSVAGLRLWPLGAQVVEPRAGVARRVLLEGGLPTLLDAGQVFAHTRGFAPFYEIHTYTRSLKEFTRAGWNDCYRRIARLMSNEPLVKGVFGASWFYDPQVERVSPRLAYLRADPASGGATFVRVKSSAQTVKLAISKSSTRKELHEQGKYQPEQWLMVWPRKALMRWAEVS